MSLVPDERDFYEQQLRAQGTAERLVGDALEDFITGGITALENSRTAQYHTLHDQWGGEGDVFQPDFQYQLTAEETAEIDASTKIWTVEELLNLQTPAFLNATDTEFVIEEMNIIGANVTLSVDDGIGQYQNGRTINLFDEDGERAMLTIDERAAVTAAEPGDIVFLTQAPSQVVAAIDNQFINLMEPGSTWSSLGFAAGQFIYLETNTSYTTDEGVFFEISSIDGSVMVLNLNGAVTQSDDPRPIMIAPVINDPAARDTATHIRVLRREDIDVRTDGIINANSSRHIFLGSDSDLNLGRIHAGRTMNGFPVGNTNQRVQIKADGAILDSLDGDVPNVIGRRITLESSSKNIGTLQNSLVIDTTREGVPFELPAQADPMKTGYLIARAQKEIAIAEFNATASAEMMFINQVFSRESSVYLVADGSILDAFDSAETNIRGTEIVLNAEGFIGSESNPVELDLIGEGQLTAFAFDSIFLTETAGNMNVRLVHSGFNEVALVADGSILDSSDVADPLATFDFRNFTSNVFRSADADPLVSGNPIPDVFGSNLKLTAINGSIGVAGNEVDISPRISADGDLKGFTGTAGTDMFVNAPIFIQSTVVGGSDLVLFAPSLAINTIRVGGTAFVSNPGGSIQSALPAGQSNILAGDAWLFANNSIGRPNAPIVTEVGALEAQAFQGNLFLQNKGDVVIGGVIDAFGDNFSGEGVDAGGDVDISSAGAVQVDELVFAVGNVSIRTTGKLTISADGAVESLEGQADLTIDGDAAAEIEVLGSLTALTQTTIQTGGGNDKVTIAPQQTTGTVFVNSGGGDDEVGTNGTPANIDGGTGANTLRIIGGGAHLDLNRFADGSIKSFDTIDMRGTAANQLTFELGKIIPTAAGVALKILQNVGDQVDFGAGWKPVQPQLIAGLFTHIISDGTATVRINNGSPYVNPIDRLDVNGSGNITALDALLIINILNNPGSHDPRNPVMQSDLVGFVFADPNNDRNITALDALLVINRLNELDAEGEHAESVRDSLITEAFLPSQPRFTSNLNSSLVDLQTLPQEIDPTGTAGSHHDAWAHPSAKYNVPWDDGFDTVAQTGQEDEFSLETTIATLATSHQLRGSVAGEQRPVREQ